MKYVIVYLSAIIFIVSCVPSTKFHKAQTEIQSLQKAITISNAYSDSIRENYIAIKSDYNNLSYDFDESQKYASFSDRDLLKELNKEKIEGKKNYDLVRQFQANSEFTYGRSILRAQTFSSDAKCILKPYSNNNFYVSNLLSRKDLRDSNFQDTIMKVLCLGKCFQILIK